MARTKEIQPGISGEAYGMPTNSIGSRRVLDGPPIPSRVMEFLNSIRKHENGGIDHKHPLINSIMRRARRQKLDVVLTADGNGVHAVTGRNITPDKIDNKKKDKKFMKIGAGVAVTATVVAGVAGFVIRHHKRGKK